MPRKEFPIRFEDLSPDLHYTSTPPLSSEWYQPTLPPVVLYTSLEEEIRLQDLLAYRCNWDLSYKTVANHEQANRYPYSYRVLSEEAIQRLFAESADP